MTPRSKHYAIKYHWFREKVKDKENNITLVKIDTKNQLGDIFTKGLTKDPLEHLRRLLMGGNRIRVKLSLDRPFFGGNIFVCPFFSPNKNSLQRCCSGIGVDQQALCWLSIV
jgi:hypothetical protein